MLTDQFIYDCLSGLQSKRDHAESFRLAAVRAKDWESVSRFQRIVKDADAARLGLGEFRRMVDAAAEALAQVVTEAEESGRETAGTALARSALAAIKGSDHPWIGG